MSVVTAVTRVAANTSTGNQTISTADLGGLTPKAVLLIATRAVTDGTAADGAGFYWGMSDGTNEVAGSYESQHAQASMDIQSNQDTTADRILTIYDGTADSVVEATADFVSFGSDGVTINWTDAPAAAYLITAIFFAGTDLSVSVGRQDLGNTADALIANTSVGFEADVVLTFWNNTIDQGDIGIGVIQNNRAGTVTQRGVSYSNRAGFSSAQVASQMRDGEAIAKTVASGGLDYWGRLESFDSSGWDVQLGNARAPASADYAWLALRFGSSPVVGSKVYTYTLPTATGSNTDSNPGFEPQLVIYLATRAATADTIETDADAGSVGVVAVDADEVYTQSVSDEDGAADSNTQSLSDDQLNLPTHTGASGHQATLTSMGSTGPVWNFGATDTGTARLFGALAIEKFTEAATDQPQSQVEFPAIDDTYLEEHNYDGWTSWLTPDDVHAIAGQYYYPDVDDTYEPRGDRFNGWLQSPMRDDNFPEQIDKHFPVIDETYDLRHDYRGWFKEPLASDFIMGGKELPVIDDTYDLEHDYQGFLQSPLSDDFALVEDFQALPEITPIDETYEQEHNYDGFVLWQIPSDVVEPIILPEITPVDETYDYEYDYSGFVGWQTPADVVVTEPLPLLETSPIDETYFQLHNYNGWQQSPMRASVEPPIPTIYPVVDELYDLFFGHDFDGWSTFPIANRPETIVELETYLVRAIVPTTGTVLFQPTAGRVRVVQTPSAEVKVQDTLYSGE